MNKRRAIEIIYACFDSLSEAKQFKVYYQQRVELIQFVGYKFRVAIIERAAYPNYEWRAVA